MPERIIDCCALLNLYAGWGGLSELAGFDVSWCISKTVFNESEYVREYEPSGNIVVVPLDLKGSVKADLLSVITAESKQEFRDYVDFATELDDGEAESLALFEDYQQRCSMGKVNPGEPYHYKDMLGNSIINFPTKDHWRSPSRIQDIVKGLDIFLANYKNWGIESVAFPALGCGNGGLKWSQVGAVMYQKLSGLDIPVEIYAPHGTPSD